MSKKLGKRIPRRKFMAGAAASAALLGQGCSIVPRHVLGGPRFIAPSEKLNIGMIGCGGRGWDNVRTVGETENIVALCDVDTRRARRAIARFPGAARYQDFRLMLENETALDAVVVSIPDHMHAPASVMAMQMGLHVYCEKPLTHSIHEARRMSEVARRQGIATQMGNGGMASEGTRQSIEIIRAGDIGEVREIHVWTDRPIWPQGLERPSESQAVPSALDWNLWLGVAPERPYHEVYAPFVWRGWQDFGTGALGDIACHSVAMVYMALDLGQPERVRAVTSPRYRETFPNWSIITFEFPARGKLPPCTLTWYDGGKHPPRELFLGEDFGSGGTLIVGSKGRLHGNTLLPRKDFEGYEPPEPTLPRVTGHHQEWIAACKGGAKPFSNFDFASQLTEAMLTGNLAIATNHEIAWDARRMRASNCREAASLIRPDYRPSFSL